MEDSTKSSGRTGKLAYAISVLESMDKCRNLHRGAAIFLFFVSAGIAVGAFFLIVDLFLLINNVVLTVKISEYVASGILILSWMLIIPMWMVAFLLIFFLLDAVGIKDLRAATTSSLSSSRLNADELHELSGVLASRSWRHGRIFKNVVVDLTGGPDNAGLET
jgi:hypothetical protein